MRNCAERLGAGALCRIAAHKPGAWRCAEKSSPAAGARTTRSIRPCTPVDTVLEDKVPHPVPQRYVVFHSRCCIVFKANRRRRTANLETGREVGRAAGRGRGEISGG